MKTLEQSKLNGNIILLSRVGSFVLICGLILSYLTQNIILDKIQELESKKVVIDNVYNNMHEFKYQTELLLTSYDIDVKKDIYHNSFIKYDKSMSQFLLYFPNKNNILRDHNLVKSKTDDVFTILKKEVFGVENHMYKPLLVRLGELNRSEDSSQYYIVIKTFFENIEHLKQYQNFLLEDISKLKKDIYGEYNQEIKQFNILFNIFPIIIIFLSIVFAFIIDRFIKTKEMLIINTKNLLENIMNSIPVRIFWKDKNGKYLGANKLFLKDSQLKTNAELIGKNDFELPWKDTEAKNYILDDKEVMKSNLPKVNIIETQTASDGEVKHLNTSKVPLFDDYGNLTGIVGLYEDITSKVKAQETIKQHEIQLVQQNRLAQMGEMIAMIAHQWRQPLTVISSISGVMQLKIKNDKYDSVNFQDKLQKIDNQTHYLSDTIEDFRNFFRPDKKKNYIRSVDLINDTLKIIEPMLKKFNIKINNNFNCEKELYIFSNEVMQVLLNILKNAQDAFIENGVKNPEININASCCNDTKCTIYIEDNAGGIPPEIIENIFDPYFSTKSDKNGTGLGLYMSKMIIEDHCEGSLSVSSKNGKTKFEIII